MDKLNEGLPKSNIDDIQIKVSKIEKELDSHVQKYCGFSEKKPNVPEIAKIIGIDLYDTVVLTKEQSTIKNILTTFRGENMIQQYYIDGFRLDLYFPDYKLGIECDEYGHKNRDVDYEKNREKIIIKDDITLIRYNPDEKDFDIFGVINRIFLHIKNTS